MSFTTDDSSFFDDVLDSDFGGFEPGDGGVFSEMFEAHEASHSPEVMNDEASHSPEVMNDEASLDAFLTQNNPQKLKDFLTSNRDLLGFVDHYGFNVLALALSCHKANAEAVLAVDPTQINGVASAFRHFMRIGEVGKTRWLIDKGFSHDELVSEAVAREAWARSISDRAASACSPVGGEPGASM